MNIFPSFSKKAGQSPGSLIYTGTAKDTEVKATVVLVDYDPDKLEIKELDSLDDCRAYLNEPTTTWINVVGLHDTKLIEHAGEMLNLHPLVLEDILNVHQRPKVEDHEDYLYLVVKILSLEPDSIEVHSEQLSIIIRKNVVMTFVEGQYDFFNPIMKRIRDKRPRIRNGGTDYLAYTLLDRVVDNYFIVLESQYNTIEKIEAELDSNPSRETLDAIHKLKRSTIYLRKSIAPARDVIRHMLNEDYSPIRSDVAPYFRDVEDHVVECVDIIDHLRDILGGLAGSYDSAIANRTNEIMKVLTIVSIMFIPLTFMAGIYGMNFEYIPELRWRMGYFTLLGVMAVMLLIMIYYFKKKKWF